MRFSRKNKSAMSATDYAPYRRAVIWMEDREAKRQGARIDRARSALARSIGVAPGTLLDIRRGRLKSLRGHVERLIDAALVRCLKAEIGALEHELAVAQARGVAGDRRAVAPIVEARRDLMVLLMQVPPDMVDRPGSSEETAS